MTSRREGARREATAGDESLVQRLDDVLQHRARLAASVLLARDGQLSFSRLKVLLEETDGNLGAQMRKLEDAGYVAARKTFEDRRPVTWYSLTAKGTRALSEHLAGLERLIGHARRSRR